MPITSPNLKLSSPNATALSGPRPYNPLPAADIPARGRARATSRSAVRSLALAGAALAAVAAGAAGAAWPQPAQAFCGFFVSGADAQLYNNASQVALLRNG